MFVNVEDREIVVLLLGLLVAAFALAHLRQIKTFPWWPLPVAAVFCLLLGWTVSVAESVWAISWSDTVEHGLYVLHSVVFSVWAFRLSRESAVR